MNIKSCGKIDISLISFLGFVRLINVIQLWSCSLDIKNAIDRSR